MNSLASDVLRTAYAALVRPPTYYTCVTICATVIAACLVFGEDVLRRWSVLTAHICFAASALSLLELITLHLRRPTTNSPEVTRAPAARDRTDLEGRGRGRGGPIGIAGDPHALLRRHWRRTRRRGLRAAWPDAALRRAQQA